MEYLCALSIMLMPDNFFGKENNSMRRVERFLYFFFNVKCFSPNVKCLC